MSRNQSTTDGDPRTAAAPGPGATRSGRGHRWGPTVVAMTLGLGLGLTACTSSPAGLPATSTSVAPTGGSGSAGTAPAADALRIDITIAGGTVTPNGQRIDVALGRQVVLTVTSDTAEEIHAHTGGDGYELEVTPGQTATGSFTLDTAGSFEVELHESGKVVVILDAR